MNNCGLTIWAKSIDEEAVLIQYKEIDAKSGKPILMSYPVLEINYEDMYIKNCKTHTVCYFNNPAQFEILTNDIKYYTIKQNIPELNKTVRVYVGDIINPVLPPDTITELKEFGNWLFSRRYANKYIQDILSSVETLLMIGAVKDMSDTEVRQLLLNQEYKLTTVKYYLKAFRLYKEFKQGEKYEKENNQ